MKLSESSGVPFWQQLRDRLAEQIAAGSLTPGAALPSIRELAADSLVSVITVKKAYEELEHLGLVRSYQGRGTFVAEDGAAAARSRARVDIVDALDAVVRRAAAVGLDRGVFTAAFEDAADRAWTPPAGVGIPDPE